MFCVCRIFQSHQNNTKAIRVREKINHGKNNEFLPPYPHLGLIKKLFRIKHTCITWVIRSSRVGATQAVLCDTPWPINRIFALNTAHCCFNTVSSGRLTVEKRIMPEDLRWWPGANRHCFAPRYVQVCLNLKPPGPLLGDRMFNTVYPNKMWCPHRSDAGAKIRDIVNEALTSSVWKKTLMTGHCLNKCVCNKNMLLL